MAANPSCIRAVPRNTKFTEGHDSPTISMCLYMNTAGRGITDDLREEAGETFSDYNYDFVDLEIEPLGEYVSPRDCRDQKKTKEMAQVIEKNLHVFESRLNVTAVYPSYKISEAQETDVLCITVSVLGKGIIPVGEEEFPESLDGYPIDVVEGYFMPTYKEYKSKVPLHPGVGIGTRGMPVAGTLGAFLTDGENYYALSCQHVLFKLDEQPEDRYAKEQSVEQPVEEHSAKEQHTKEQPVEEHPPKKDVVSGKVQLEKRIGEKREHLKVLKQEIERLKSKESAVECDETPVELSAVGHVVSKKKRLERLKKKIDTTELKIRRIESEVRAPKQNETIVEQPAAVDIIKEIDELQEFISKNKTIVEELSKELSDESDQNDELTNSEKKADFAIHKSHVETTEKELKKLIDFVLPRCIATYSCGLNKNYCTDGETFYVDAAIAKISDDERDHILSKRNKKGSVYGFHDEKKMNGEIVPLAEIEKESEQKGLSFWKSGRTTGHTEGGKFSLNHFFMNLEGFRRNRCYGKFTNVQFETYCQTCARQVECDLVETTLLKKLKCKKCKKDIEEESKKKERWAYNCFLVFRKQGPFAEDGDSGAVIFDEEGRAWGIVVGSFDRYFNFTVAVPLVVALEALSKELGKELKLWCVNPA